jgi:hypothetical protein
VSATADLPWMGERSTVISPPKENLAPTCAGDRAIISSERFPSCQARVTVYAQQPGSSTYSGPDSAESALTVRVMVVAEGGPRFSGDQKCGGSVQTADADLISWTTKGSARRVRESGLKEASVP